MEIVRVLPESPAPQLSNIFCTCSETVHNDVTLTMDCECTPVLQLKAYRQKAGKIETSHYKATVSRFRGRLTVKMDYYKLFGDLKTEGYPEVGGPCLPSEGLNVSDRSLFPLDPHRFEQYRPHQGHQRG